METKFNNIIDEEVFLDDPSYGLTFKHRLLKPAGQRYNNDDLYALKFARYNKYARHSNDGLYALKLGINGNTSFGMVDEDG